VAPPIERNRYQCTSTRLWISEVGSLVGVVVAIMSCLSNRADIGCGSESYFFI